MRNGDTMSCTIRVVFNPRLTNSKKGMDLVYRVCLNLSLPKLLNAYMMQRSSRLISCSSIEARLGPDEVHVTLFDLAMEESNLLAGLKWRACMH